MERSPEPEGAAERSADSRWEERLKVEESLRRAERKYRDIFNHITEGIYQITPDGRWVSANPALARILGYGSVEELQQQVTDPRRIYVDAGHWQDLVRQAEEQGEVKRLDSRVYRKDGEAIWIRENTHPVRDAQDGIRFYEGTVGDITEQKLAEQALRDSEERYRLIVDNALDAIIVIDQHGIILGWNPRAEKIFGWSRQEALGQDFLDLMVPAEDRETRLAARRRFLETGESALIDRRVELRALHRDGRELPVEVTVSSARLASSAIFSIFIQDITARKQAQEALHLAKEAAEAATRAKSEFLANMSHEIRTPMNGVVGMTELLLETELSAQQRQYLEMVRTSADSLLTLLNAVLDLSKIEARKLVLEQVGFGLRDRLADCLRTLSVQAAEKGVELVWQVLPGVPDALVGDPIRLGQVLINLAGNAVKFTVAGKVEVRADLESRTGTAAVLRFSVRDTGIGIDAGKLEHVFRAFEQADSSTGRKYGGSGLGLSISAELVRAMDGRIRVESEVGRGSTFTFTARFGLWRGSAAAARQRVASRSAATEPSADEAGLPPLTVLLVEDDVINQTVARGMLERWRLEVEVASRGREALHRLRQKPIDLLLLDLQMPDMDGFEVTAAIRRGEAAGGGHLPIVALTAYAMDGDRERCLAAGMDGYVAKPIRRGALYAAIRGALVGRSEPQPTAEVDWQDGSVFDRQAFLDQLSGRVDRARSLLEIFLEEDGPEGLKAVCSAVEKRDASRLRETAHALKGALGAVCAPLAFATAGELESAGRMSDLERVDEKYERLDQQVRELVRVLTAFIEEV